MFDGILAIDKVRRTWKTDNFNYSVIKKTMLRPANGESEKHFEIVLNNDLAIRTTEMLPTGTKIQSNIAAETIDSTTEEDINLTLHSGTMNIILLPMELTETLETVSIQFIIFKKNN